MKRLLICAHGIRIGTTQSTGFAAIKMTALGRPQLLVIILVTYLHKASFRLTIVYAVATVRGNCPQPALLQRGDRSSGQQHPAAQCLAVDFRETLRRGRHPIR